MTRSVKGNLKSRGFTLIEVIVTILAVAIVGVIFISFMGTAMSKSFRPIEMVQGEALAEATLERIVADYVLKINQDESTALGLIKTDIDNKIVYGPNVVATYILFDANGNETSDTAGLNRTLKITYAAPGNDLVTLLAKSRNSNSPPVTF